MPSSAFSFPLLYSSPSPLPPRHAILHCFTTSSLPATPKHLNHNTPPLPPAPCILLAPDALNIHPAPLNTTLLHSIFNTPPPDPPGKNLFAVLVIPPPPEPITNLAIFSSIKPLDLYNPPVADVHSPASPPLPLTPIPFPPLTPLPNPPGYPHAFTVILLPSFITILPDTRSNRVPPAPSRLVCSCSGALVFHTSTVSVAFFFSTMLSNSYSWSERRECSLLALMVSTPSSP
mmetsp:Transcript_44310/g.70978  ORF Transcript_44310/g.70978 Transcript_44310/m.70978 type:complete len:232 (-) Transcript_44310:542-1237(-)